MTSVDSLRRPAAATGELALMPGWWAGDADAWPGEAITLLHRLGGDVRVPWRPPGDANTDRKRFDVGTAGGAMGKAASWLGPVPCHNDWQ